MPDLALSLKNNAKRVYELCRLMTKMMSLTLLIQKKRLTITSTLYFPLQKEELIYLLFQLSQTIFLLIDVFF